MRLSDQGREDALIISQTLNYMKNLGYDETPSRVMEMGAAYFSKGNLSLEYLEIVDAESLMLLTNQWSAHCVCCIAAYCEDVRLIDNLEM
jgi:pantoate--beta-alanine ligase